MMNNDLQYEELRPSIVVWLEEFSEQFFVEQLLIFQACHL